MLASNTMRPTYETEEDLKRETEISLIVSQAFKCELRKLHKYNQFDYAAIRNGKIVAFLEMRRRNNNMSKYPTMIVSMNKVLSAHLVKIAANLETFFVVMWDDCVGYTSLSRQFEVQVGGRIDRNDLADIEAVCHIPIKDFVAIT